MTRVSIRTASHALLAAGARAVAAACHDAPVAPTGAPDASTTTLAGGAVRLTHGASGLNEHRIEYDWTVWKGVIEIMGEDMVPQQDLSTVEILPGHTAWIDFYVIPRRSVATDASVLGVRGQTCIDNSSGHAVSKIQIVERVQSRAPGGTFRDVTGAGATLQPSGQIDAGQSQCFPYEVLFAPTAGLEYRAEATVTGSGLGGKAVLSDRFDVPAEQSLFVVDSIATLADGAFAACEKYIPQLKCASVMSLPYTATFYSTNDGRWSHYAEGDYWTNFTVDMTNPGVCGREFDYINDEPLREGGPNPPGGEVRPAVARLHITTGKCQTPPPPSACTRTIGYWKTHAGFGPQPDVVTPLLPQSLGLAGGAKTVTVTTAAQAYSILGMQGGASNGIVKLYAQLLGAKLNIAQGSDPSAIASTIAAADAFLATHNAADWSGLTNAQKQQVLDWMTTLDSYNSGKIGPGHCDF